VRCQPKRTVHAPATDAAARFVQKQLNSGEIELDYREKVCSFLALFWNSSFKPFRRPFLTKIMAEASSNVEASAFSTQMGIPLELPTMVKYSFGSLPSKTLTLELNPKTLEQPLTLSMSRYTMTFGLVNLFLRNSAASWEISIFAKFPIMCINPHNLCFVRYPDTRNNDGL
jgi:hypothetical protein